MVDELLCSSCEELMGRETIDGHHQLFRVHLDSPQEKPVSRSESIYSASMCWKYNRQDYKQPKMELNLQEVDKKIIINVFLYSAVSFLS